MVRGVLVLALLLLGCAQEPTSTTTTVGQITTSVPATVTTRGLVATCAVGELTEGGQVGSIPQIGSDSQTLGLISWETAAPCETFTFSFETPEGAPATTPPSVVVEYLDPAPVLRITTDVTNTVITDQLVETGLVDRLYVVEAGDGSMLVDLHLRAPAQAHVDTAASPARVIVTLQPGIVEHNVGVASTEGLVLVRPLDRAAVGMPVTIQGYTRFPSVLLLVTSGNSVLVEEEAIAAGDGSTWGLFEATLDLPPGEASLFTGLESTDGGLQGVTIEVTVG